MREIVKSKFNKKIDYKKIIATLICTSTITSLAACSNNKNESLSEVTSNTTIETTIETTNIEPTNSTVIEYSNDEASVDYMNYAKSVAVAMYDANKEYFDEKNYTVEDLENVYYVLNGKYYDSNKNLIMDKVQLDRSLDVIRELAEPQRVIEMLQKYRDLEHGNLSYDEYLEEVKSSKFYNYGISLSNFIDNNKDNNDVRNFANDYSEIMIKVTKNIENGVSPEETLIEFFSKIRSAQTGNVTNYLNINNYLQETTANDGKGFLVASIYKAVPDFINTVNDNIFINVQDEDVRIGYTYDERMLVNAYYLGDLVNYDDIYNAKILENQLFQTMPLYVMCDKENKINENMGFYTYTNSKAYTLGN